MHQKHSQPDSVSLMIDFARRALKRLKNTMRKRCVPASINLKNAISASLIRASHKQLRFQTFYLV